MHCGIGDDAPRYLDPTFQNPSSTPWERLSSAIVCKEMWVNPPGGRPEVGLFGLLRRAVNWQPPQQCHQHSALCNGKGFYPWASLQKGCLLCSWDRCLKSPFGQQDGIFLSWSKTYPRRMYNGPKTWGSVHGWGPRGPLAMIPGSEREAGGVFHA